MSPAEWGRVISLMFQWSNASGVLINGG